MRNSYKINRTVSRKKKHYKKKSLKYTKKHYKKKSLKHNKKHYKKNLKGGSVLGSTFINDGLLSTSYTLGNVTPQNLALANPIPINTYSKCPQ